MRDFKQQITTAGCDRVPQRAANAEYRQNKQQCSFRHSRTDNCAGLQMGMTDPRQSCAGFTYLLKQPEQICWKIFF